ncbi:MAG: hypothetical protein LCI00_14990 [Chloroflexi bacterium]|nr:hypothetical protein [Chloroflexota bacterium]MCC6892603.1 hypothetical protein [Anaerolineae bacterium]
MKIFDLLIPEFSKTVAGNSPFPDYFYDDDSLLEATLLDLMHYTLDSTTALLFDLRTAMYLSDGNTMVIVFRGVKDVVLTDKLTIRHVWMIGDSRFSKTDEGVKLQLPLMERNISIAAQKLDVYIGNAKNIGEIGTSLDEGIMDYLQTTPHWESAFEVITSSEWK